jgi:hypothetical protein
MSNQKSNMQYCVPPAVNKPHIEKCIVSFSHNRYESRKAADRISIDKARREIAAGKRGISHLILRGADDDIDQLKFLFLIHGIPLMCYSLANLIFSSLREIVVIGSEEVKRVLDGFLEVVGTNGKSIHFVGEDPQNLSLLNTMRLGRGKLSLAPDEMALFQPGDLPFMYDIEKVLRDKDIQSHNLILWLNSRQKMFPLCMADPNSEFVRRNYHYRAIDEDNNELHEIKEPNIYPINLDAVESDIIELLHETRKDGKILKAGFYKALTLPARFIRLLPVFARHAMYFRSDLKRFVKKDEYQFGMHLKNFNNGAAILLNTAFTSKVHNDPAFVADVDALEDWEDFESLIHHACKLHGEDGLTRIHPCGELLLKFKEKVMPRLKKQIPIYADFPAYLNRIYRTLEMPYQPFDADGNYIKPNSNLKVVENAYRWYSKKTPIPLENIR